MESLLGALAMLMEQQRRQPAGGYGSTKALKGVVEKIGRFDGKNITNFLKVYLCEMEVHQIFEDHMIQAFGLAMVPEIRDEVREIMQDEAVNTWAAFGERLRMSISGLSTCPSVRVTCPFVRVSWRGLSFVRPSESRVHPSESCVRPSVSVGQASRPSD